MAKPTIRDYEIDVEDAQRALEDALLAQIKENKWVKRCQDHLKDCQNALEEQKKI